MIFLKIYFFYKINKIAKLSAFIKSGNLRIFKNIEERKRKKILELEKIIKKKDESVRQCESYDSQFLIKKKRLSHK